jgi:hypothetical protein
MPALKPRHDVDEERLDDNLQIDVWVGLQERRHHRRQDQPDCGFGRVDTEPAGRFVGNFADLGDGIAEFAERRRDAVEQPLAGLGGREAARRAVQKADSQAFFQIAQALAEARHRYMEFGRRATEVAVLGDRGKGTEIAIVDAVHCSAE